jgi:hypothetical protein
MRIILLAVSLLTASISYAEINKDDYIYNDDSQETISAKEDLKEAQDKSERLKFKIAKDFRNKGTLASTLASTSSEVVYKVGDSSKRNIGARNGMTPAQVLNETYWGQPDNIIKGSDENGSFEQWSYRYYGTLHFDNGKLASILRFKNP